MSGIYRARFVLITAFVLCPLSQLWAEDKEPFAVVELGAATEPKYSSGYLQLWAFGFG
jgi:hypothetical protein